MSLDDLREQIDTIDTTIVDLLNQRAAISIEVGKRKAMTADARYFAPERERDMMQRLLQIAPDGHLPKESLQAIFREIISASIALQKPLTVAYWGPRGTFTEMAAQQRFGRSTHYHDCRTIPDVFGEVERDRADYGVVPVENSTDGVIPYTLDMFHETSLKVCAEIYVRIVQNLITNAASLDKIRRVYAAPIVLAQCRRWMDTYLPNVEIVDVAPTTKAAERVLTDPEGAAIGPKRAGEVLDLPSLYESVEDSPHNRTRFLVIGRNSPPPTGRDKTSILFAVKNEPGSLGRALRSFEAHTVNLTMIASRPAKNSTWEYVQFVDVQGHQKDEPVRLALDALSTHSIYVNVLGSYPEA